MNNNKWIWIIGIIAALIIISQIFPSGLKLAGETSSRTFTSPSYINQDITISLSINPGDSTYYAIDEIYPSGWTVVSASDGGDFTSDPGHIKWVVISGAVSKTYTYVVNPGSNTGTFAFAGTFGFENPPVGPTEVSIGGTSSIQITTCTPETDTVFCSRLSKTCGSYTALDNCGTSRTANCGTCTTGFICTNNVCVAETCTPETDTVFCSRLSKACGSYTAPDNCEVSRTANCGTCNTGYTCTNNVCVSSTCTPATCPSLGKTCGNVSDGCGGTLSCGTCTVSGQVCTNNVCTECMISTWTPSGATYCTTETFTQTSNCLTTRSAVGTKSCPANTTSSNLTNGTCTTNSNCDDNSICTEDRCINLKCVSLPVNEGGTCWTSLYQQGKCASGICKAIVTESVECKSWQILEDGACKTSPFVWIAIILGILVGYYYLEKKGIIIIRRKRK